MRLLFIYLLGFFQADLDSSNNLHLQDNKNLFVTPEAKRQLTSKQLIRTGDEANVKLQNRHKNCLNKYTSCTFCENKSQELYNNFH